jgi:hypothetical protein
MEDETGDAICDADAERGPAPRPYGRTGPPLVRRISRQQNRDVRYQTQKFQEWSVPTPWTNVYDAIGDKAGFAWAGGHEQRSYRPREHEERRSRGVSASAHDERSARQRRQRQQPAGVLGGNNLGASLIRVEPLE